MAIRYSGDVELRIQPGERGLYTVRVRAPRERALVEVHRPFLFRKSDSSVAYDVVAKETLETLIQKMDLPLEFDDSGEIVIRRVFQSPCPT